MATARVDTEARRPPDGLPRFSVIVPLALHHQAERALLGWTRDQTYPRERYEVLAVAPPGLAASALGTWQLLLQSRDRLLRCPEPHDMSLYMAGARAAGGELLLFTESHCWPEPDTLEKAEQVLRVRPDLGGFSGRSRRSTHSRLSNVEADLYERDAARLLLRHPWCAVLDHLFVVRRESFFRAGGFDPSLGHFAEWALAARLHHMAVAVEHVPELLVYHYYAGLIDVWREFTEDFVDGQMRFMDERSSEPCAGLLPEVPEWSGRANWCRATAARMLALAWRDWLRRRHPGAAGGSPPLGDVVRALARWTPAALGGARPALLGAQVQAWSTRWRLSWAVRFERPDRLRTALERYWTAVITQRRLRWLLHGSGAAEPRSGDGPDGRQAGEWEPARVMTLPVAGFHLAESWQGQPFRWSEPVATIQLPLYPGRYRLDVEWLPVRPATQPPEPRFYLNERPLGPEQIQESDRAGLSVLVPPGGAARLGWGTRPWRAPGDRRALGLPIRRIRWRPERP